MKRKYVVPLNMTRELTRLLRIASDEATIEFIKHVNATNSSGRFIIEAISPTHVFVKPKSLSIIVDAMRRRDEDNTYTSVRGIVDPEHSAAAPVQTTKSGRRLKSKR